MQLPDKGFLNVTSADGLFVVVDSEGPLCKTESLTKLEELLLAEATLGDIGGARELVFPGTHQKKATAMGEAKTRVEGLRQRMLEKMGHVPSPNDPVNQQTSIRAEGLD